MPNISKRTLCYRHLGYFQTFGTEVPWQCRQYQALRLMRCSFFCTDVNAEFTPSPKGDVPTTPIRRITYTGIKPALIHVQMFSSIRVNLYCFLQHNRSYIVIRGGFHNQYHILTLLSLVTNLVVLLSIRRHLYDQTVIEAHLSLNTLAHTLALRTKFF